MNMVDYKVIGARIRAKRLQAKMTQEFVSESVGITSVYLSKIENGKVRPTIDTLSAICDTVNCDLGAVFMNTSSASNQYENETVVKLFHACRAEVKPIALNLLKQLSKL